jgi:uncharacterized protein (TIGR02270 family)
MRREPLIFWDVVEEHLDEAEFLWSQWEQGLVSPSFSLAEVEARLEERLFAQIDGLLAAGPRAEARLLLPALSAEEPSRVAAAALALLCGEGNAGIAAVFAALAGAAPAARAALVRALGLAERDDLGAFLLTELGAETATVQAAVLTALNFRGVDPGRSLSRIGASDPPALRIAGLEAARASRTRPLQELAGEWLGADDPAIRQEAIVTGVILGLPAAWAASRRLVQSGTAAGAGALALLAIGGDALDQEAVIGAVGNPALRARAIEALGYGGWVRGAEVCLELIGDPVVGKLAGEAFWAITGVPREGVFLRKAPAEEAVEPIPLAEERLDERAVPSPEEALPGMDGEQVAAWWRENRARFDRQTRYLYGEPMRGEAVVGALRRGPMRRRHALGLEVAMRSRGRLRVETRAFSRRQWEEIERLGELEGIAFGEPLV